MKTILTCTNRLPATLTAIHLLLSRSETAAVKLGALDFPSCVLDTATTVNVIFKLFVAQFFYTYVIKLFTRFIINFCIKHIFVSKDFYVYQYVNEYNITWVTSTMLTRY